MRQKMKITAITIVVFVTVIAASAFSVTESKTYTGYLVDVLCWDSGIGADGSKVRTNPEDHTVMCALMKPCIQSGYVLLSKNSSGEYESYPLDKKGNKLAVKYFKNVQKKDNILVNIAGTWDGNELTVKTITD